MAGPNQRDVARALEAARGGDHETLRLISTGRKASSAPLVLGDALRIAAESGHVDTLKSLLQFGAPPVAGAPPAVDENRTPLAAACAGGHTECAAMLLARGAQDDDAAFTFALRGDHSGCLRALVMSNGSLSPRDLAALPGLLCAAVSCDALACMDELRRLGCDPCAHGSATTGTPLSVACESGRPRAVLWLLERGAPVDAAPHPERRTALHWACARGHADCAALLIHHGARVDLADSSGETPLAAALNCGHAACATLLLDHGARAAADCLVCLGINGYSSCWGLVPRLLAAEADADCRNQHGRTPLMLAALYGTSAAVRALCAVGADASAADNDRRTPLYGVALFMGFTLFVERLEEGLVATLPAQIEKGLVCTDELVERGGAELLLKETSFDDLPIMALERGLYSLEDVSDKYSRTIILQLTDGCLALMLARWPLSAPLPEYEGVGALLPAAVGHAQRRLDVLRSGLDDGAGMQQQALTAAFLRRVRDACGGAVAPAYAPFARLRFVAGGGLGRAWAGEREVHRFPVERVALARAALQVASDAQAAAGERCVPLLRELSAAGSGRRSCSSSQGAGKLRYAAAIAVGRWGAIRAAVSRAEEGVRSGKAALNAAVAEAEAQVGRLMQAKAVAEAAAARAAAPAE